MTLTYDPRGLGGCFCASSPLKRLHIKNKGSISPTYNVIQDIGHGMNRLLQLSLDPSSLL